jgi:hypothetical protein
MNLPALMAVAAIACFSVSNVSHADETDTKAESFTKLYVSLCLRHINNPGDLRNELAKNDLSKLPPDEATLFLNDAKGDAWAVPSQEELGNFVLALPAGNNLCVVYARRANQAGVERRFAELTATAPAPLIVEKKLDKKSEAVPNGETHTVSYTWSAPQAQQKMVFTLTTSASENAQIQAMASAAMVNE